MKKQSKHQTSATSPEEEEAVALDYATITSLALQIDNRGNLIIEQRGVEIDVLKDTLEGAFPEWAGLQETVDAARWVSDNLNGMSKTILEEFGENESVRIQERNV